MGLWVRLWRMIFIGPYERAGIDEMAKMLLGKKIGMTRLYNDGGVIEPVTVIQAGPCTVMQIKTEQTDGYVAMQLGFGDVKRSRQKKPQIGHAKKANAVVKSFIRELRLDDASGNEVGDKLTVEVFEGVNYVDVVGVSKGKGFAGVMKRHGFKGMPASRGCERKHRHPGGIGSNSGSAGTARAIRKGKKMGGHMGHVRCTSCNRRVVDIDVGNNLLMVKGPVPGPANGFVMIRTAKTRQ